MILRRFMKHVTDQNWFAVGLDVLVVITGIFLGMQVTDWNEARQDAARETHYIDRLIAEGDVAIEELQGHVAQHKRAIDASIKMIALMADREACLSTDENLIQLMMTMTSFPPLRITMPTIRELGQSGQMQLIRSDTIVGLLTDIADDLEFLKLQWNRYRVLKTELDREIFSTAGFVAASTGLFDGLGQINDGSGYLLTPERLCAHSRLIGQASGEQTTHQSYHIYAEGFGAFLAEYRDKLTSYRQTLA